jgi:hypothetical protein
MEKILIFGILILTFILSSCQTQIVCNNPYILVGTECCLDTNDNRICDKDEEITPITTTTTIQLVLQRVCGDGICYPKEENWDTCPEDCENVFFISEFFTYPSEDFAMTLLRNGLSKPIKNINYRYFCKTNFGNFDSSNANMTLVYSEGETQGSEKIFENQNIQIRSGFHVPSDSQAYTDSGKPLGNLIENLPVSNAVSFALTFYTQKEYAANCSVTFTSEDPFLAETREFVIE